VEKVTVNNADITMNNVISFKTLPFIETGCACLHLTAKTVQFSFNLSLNTFLIFNLRFYDENTIRLRSMFIEIVLMIVFSLIELRKRNNLRNDRRIDAPEESSSLL